MAFRLNIDEYELDSSAFKETSSQWLDNRIKMTWADKEVIIRIKSDRYGNETESPILVKQK